MKKNGIDWGYLMGKLLLQTANYEGPNPFTVDENGALAEGYDEEDADGLQFAAGQSYPLCTDWIQEDPEDPEEEL